MEIYKEIFKKKYPKIIEEIEQNSNKIKISSIENIEELPKNNKNKENLRGYDPTIIDFIRRCTTSEEADSIINYLEKKGEITKKYAKSIRDQIKDKGIRSFGLKKKENYYFEKSEKITES